MKLQHKLILILAGLWLTLSLCIYGYSKFVLVEDYKHIENSLITQNTNEAKRAIKRAYDSLELYTISYSQWDDAYEFMREKTDKFIQSNVVSGTFTAAKINFWLFYDEKGNYYFGRYYDLLDNTFKSVPENLLNYLSNNRQFVTHTSLDSKKTGIINTTNGPIIMTSFPILTGNATGPIRGAMLMGYYLNDSVMKNLSDIVSMPISLITLPLANNDTKHFTVLKRLSSGLNHDVFMPNNQIAYSYFLISDINQQPAGLIKIEIPRIIYNQGVSTANNFIKIEIALGIVVIFIVSWLLKHYIVDRILSVSEQIAEVNHNNQFDHRIKLSGNDEIGKMANSINEMIDVITATQSTLRHMALHDSLTGLPNRAYFHDLLTNAMAEANKNKSQLAVLFLDMDKFKQINDINGHDVGDQLLKIIANRLQGTLKQNDIACRQSGDEFILLLNNVQSERMVSIIATRILYDISRNITIDDKTLSLTFSIGISLYPKDGLTVDELLKHADEAMYYSKSHGNRYSFYQARKRVVENSES